MRAFWSTGSMVNRTSPLNARQVEVLAWIANGCPDGVMKDFTYKTTAVALQGRRLVAVSRKGGGWQAALTEVGSYYLEHGAYPAETAASGRPSLGSQRISRQPGIMPRPSTPGQARQVGAPGREARTLTIDGQAQDLVARVIRAGGVLELDLEDDETDYKHLLTAAKRAPNLPFGKQLRMRSVGPYWSDDHEIYIGEDFEPRVPPRPVPVPERVAAYHPVVKAYRADPDRHEVSKGSFDRACRILQGLVAEAQRRGYTVRTVELRRPVRLKDGQIEIVIDGFRYRLRVQERAGQGGGPRRYTLRGPKLPRWQEVRQTTFVPTGELRITHRAGLWAGGPSCSVPGRQTSIARRAPACPPTRAGDQGSGRRLSAITELSSEGRAAIT